ncbi:hypothetical protein PG987_009737 [Apiospora arundinis]
MDNISKPEKSEDADAFFPNRWLASGTPYEFAASQTRQPPQTLINRFHDLVREAKLEDVLGLYYVDGPVEDPAVIEWTQGREDWTRALTEEDKANDPVQTAWNFARGGDPVTMASWDVLWTYTVLRAILDRGSVFQGRKRSSEAQLAGRGLGVADVGELVYVCCGIVGDGFMNHLDRV